MSGLPGGFVPDDEGDVPTPHPPRPAPRPTETRRVVPIPPALQPRRDRRPWLFGIVGLLAGFILGLTFAAAANYLRTDWLPEPAPIPTPVGALRVILVSDSSGKMSEGQLAALNSTAVRDWLKTHCAKDSKGRAAWRSWDSDVDPADMPEDWRKAWATAKPLLGPLPQAVIFHGEHAKAVGIENEKGLLEVLEKAGGR